MKATASYSAGDGMRASPQTAGTDAWAQTTLQGACKLLGQMRLCACRTTGSIQKRWGLWAWAGTIVPTCPPGQRPGIGVACSSCWPVYADQVLQTRFCRPGFADQVLQTDGLHAKFQGPHAVRMGMVINTHH